MTHTRLWRSTLCLKWPTCHVSVHACFFSSFPLVMVVTLTLAACCSQTLTYIDRSNVSFASLQFRGDLGLTAGEYGLGAGIFYIGYAAFQVLFLNAQTGGLGLSHDSAQESGVLGHCGPPSPHRRPV